MPSGTPTVPSKLWIRVGFAPDPMKPAYEDATIYGVSNLSNVPYGRLTYSKINSIGRQWCRQYVLSLSKELLGWIRSKFSTIPIPGADLTLNGEDLLTSAREEKEVLKTKLTEMLEALTYSKMLEDEAAASENLMRILKNIPIPSGRAIIMG